MTEVGIVGALAIIIIGVLVEWGHLKRMFHCRDERCDMTSEPGEKSKP